jgi:parallel beta-helix repeat protein
VSGRSFFSLFALVFLVVGTLAAPGSPGRLGPGEPSLEAAPAAALTVCPAGPPACGYATVQEAVDAAGDGDVIKVAGGVYSGVQGRPAPPGYNGPAVITQVVYISKSLTLRGGYTTSNGFADPPDPIANPSVLDAQGQGRVLFVAGEISTTLEGLRVTGGNAAGLGGAPWVGDAGAGVYVLSSTVTVSGSRFYGNTVIGLGGGLALVDSTAALRGNIASDNAGGGIFLYGCEATLEGNSLSRNVAEHGGGVHAREGEYREATTVLTDNTIISNSADIDGGGLYIQGKATLSGNTLVANAAAIFAGGLFLRSTSATIVGNTFSANRAALYGGGAYLDGSATLAQNTFRANAAGWGGGLYASGDLTFTNNVVVENQADVAGSGLCLGYYCHSFRFLHTTVAHNSGGDGSGICCRCSTALPLALTNTILVSQTVGLTLSSGCSARLAGTLWEGNGQDWGGAGTISHTYDYTGTPAFLNPALGDYHLGAASAAIDRGVDSGVGVDIDGEPRPAGAGYDLGADEYHRRVALGLGQAAFPEVVPAGASLTYTLRLTNGGNVELHAAITDTLPAHVAPGGVLTWTAQVAPTRAWTETVVVAVEPGYAGELVNVLRAGSLEGGDGPEHRHGLCRGAHRRPGCGQ